ncbi:MAG: cytochrome c biogenesis protein CcdA [Candidatus Firestonebacteria bacterium]
MTALVESLRAALEQGSWIVYFLSLAGGIMVSFEPCIYTMLPITVTFIATQSGGSKFKGFTLSLVYVLGLALIYTVLGAVASLTGSYFGSISTKPLPNIIMGGVCILLSLSMFDVYSLQMPAWVNNLANKKIGSGFVTIFFLGLISGLVVGPCTGAVLGTLLIYVGKSGNVLFGTTLLFVFSLGMGLLLIAAGTFAGILMALPRAGAWMEKIRKVMGFILLIIGGYFIYIAGRYSAGS